MTDLNVAQAGYDLTQGLGALIELLDIMTVLWELIKETLLHDNNMPYDISITEGIFLKLIEMASENMIYASYSVQEEEGHQIIKEHINWYSNAAKAGFIAVRRPFVSRVLSNLSEQEIISLAEYVAKAANKDAILLIEREYTIKSAFDFLESWIKISGYSYRHEETDNGQNKHSYAYNTIWEGMVNIFGQLMSVFIGRIRAKQENRIGQSGKIH